MATASAVCDERECLDQRHDIVVMANRSPAGRCEPVERRRRVERSALPGAEPTATTEEIGAALDPRYTFDNFVVGKPNESPMRRRDAWPMPIPYVQPAVPLWRRRSWQDPSDACRGLAHPRAQSDPSVLYLSAEKFMYRFVRALRFQDTMAFKEQFRSVDVPVIDDVQFHRRQRIPRRRILPYHSIR